MQNWRTSEAMEFCSFPLESPAQMGHLHCGFNWGFAHATRGWLWGLSLCSSRALLWALPSFHRCHMVPCYHSCHQSAASDGTRSPLPRCPGKGRWGKEAKRTWCWGRWELWNGDFSMWSWSWGQGQPLQLLWRRGFFFCNAFPSRIIEWSVDHHWAGQFRFLMA